MNQKMYIKELDEEKLVNKQQKNKYDLGKIK